MKLRSWDNLNVGDFCKFKEGDNIIVIDVTNKPWVKQLGTIGKDETRIMGVSNIIKRHLAHCRCMTPIGLKDNSTYCEKCRQKVPSKSLCFKSIINNKLIKTKKIIIGEAFVDSSKPIILIDLEYSRRPGNVMI